MNRFWLIKGEYHDPADPSAKPVDVYMSLAEGSCHWYNSVSSGQKYPTLAQAQQDLRDKADFGTPKEIFNAKTLECNVHPTGRP